jgi:hypothetical protein
VRVATARDKKKEKESDPGRAMEGLQKGTEVPQSAYEAPASQNQRAKDSRLFAACRRGDIVAVEDLLAQGILVTAGSPLSKEEINAARPGDGLTALACACWAGHAEIVSALLKDARTDVSIVSAAGETALEIAQASERSDIVDHFLESDGLAWADAWMEAQTKRATAEAGQGGNAPASTPAEEGGGSLQSISPKVATTAGLSKCSACQKERPSSAFSAAQKKKKTKRRCKACVE